MSVRKPTKRIQRSEFFEDTTTDIGGPYRTPTQIKKLFSWLKRDQKENPIYSEAANVRLLEKYTQRAKSETRHVVDARTVIERAGVLRSYMAQGDLHGSVYAAILLQEAYMRLILRQREPDAKTGRVHKQRSREGAEAANASRKQKPNAKHKLIREDYKRYLQTTDPRDISGILAKRYKLSPSQIRRIKNKRASR